MARFVQLHLLTAYPPSNLNRDDLGRPKSAVFGGRRRLRVSSQCLKRTWRTSETFESALTGHLGTRTKSMGRHAYETLVTAGVAAGNAEKWAEAIAKTFGKPKAKHKAGKSGEQSERQRLQHLDIEQLAHFGPDEIAAIDALCKSLAERGEGPKDDDLALLVQRPKAVDVAMFGRMLADSPKFNVEAAAQVAHAITVHAADIEEDYFSAVDDLNVGDEDAGAGHIGEQGFGAGVFYTYICVDTQQLLENLSGDTTLVADALGALIEAATTVAPTGKQNSFASRAYASYVMAEKGDWAPRSLAAAFLKPVAGSDVVNTAVSALRETRLNLNRVYDAETESEELYAQKGEGSLGGLKRFVAAAVVSS